MDQDEGNRIEPVLMYVCVCEIIELSTLPLALADGVKWALVF